MKWLVFLFFILIIIKLPYIKNVLSIINFKYINTEKFICNTNTNNVDKLFTPLSIINSTIDDSRFNINDTNLINTKSNLLKLIEKIDIKTINYKFHQLPPNKFNYNYGYQGYNYDKKNLSNVILKLFSHIKKNFEKTSSDLFPKLCNKLVKCELQLIDMRIISLGKYKNELCINGQLLLKFNSSSYVFVLLFLISETNNSLNIYKLTLDDIGLLSNQNINPFSEQLSILSSPDYGTYNANNTYLYNSYESNYFKDFNSSIYKIDSGDDPVIQGPWRDDEYKCYGGEFHDKYNCNNVYDSYGKIKKRINVWDRPCQHNSDCPFYKKNKNYENNFGGCKRGYCEYPLGTTVLSPRQYLPDNKMKCHNCKKIYSDGTSCCYDQLNKNDYPHLKSPDYVFKDDYTLRNSK